MTHSQHHDVRGQSFAICWFGCMEYTLERVKARYPDMETITVEEEVTDKLLSRRHRALELAREHVNKTKEKDQYDKSLNASNRLAEELKVARFLLGGDDD